MKILFISDIVGGPGRETVTAFIADIKKEYSIDFTIANGENSAGGLGITPAIFDELRGLGIDVITTGNHIWKRKEVLDIVDKPRLIRPANYPKESPGHGFGKYDHNGLNIGVVNLQGRIFMNPIDSPFEIVDKILNDQLKCEIIIVDFHAEATSEKSAMGWYLDGKVSAVIGTHTHIQTSDNKILPSGTAYITDAGMTGSTVGVIGVKKEEIIKSFITGMPFSYKGSRGMERFQGVVIDIDESTGKALSIERIDLSKEN